MPPKPIQSSPKDIVEEAVQTAHIHIDNAINQNQQLMDDRFNKTNSDLALIQTIMENDKMLADSRYESIMNILTKLSIPGNKPPQQHQLPTLDLVQVIPLFHLIFSAPKTLYIPPLYLLFILPSHNPPHQHVHFLPPPKFKPLYHHPLKLPATHSRPPMLFTPQTLFFNLTQPLLHY